MCGHLRALLSRLPSLKLATVWFAAEGYAAWSFLWVHLNGGLSLDKYYEYNPETYSSGKEGVCRVPPANAEMVTIDGFVQGVRPHAVWVSLHGGCHHGVGDWVDCACFLSVAFLGGARRLELSQCNTLHS